MNKVLEVRISRLEDRLPRPKPDLTWISDRDLMRLEGFLERFAATNVPEAEWFKRLPRDLQTVVARLDDPN